MYRWCNALRLEGVAPKTENVLKRRTASITLPPCTIRESYLISQFGGRGCASAGKLQMSTDEWLTTRLWNTCYARVARTQRSSCAGSVAPRIPCLAGGSYRQRELWPGSCHQRIPVLVRLTVTVVVVRVRRGPAVAVGSSGTPPTTTA